MTNNDDSSYADASTGTWPSPAEPLDVARRYIDAFRRFEGGRETLVHHRGEFYTWTGQHWTGLEDNELKAELYAVLGAAEYEGEKGARAWDPNRRKIGDVLDAAAAAAHLPAAVDTPAWITTDDGFAPRPPAGELVACDNGLLHVPTRVLHPHTPELFNLVSVPFAYDPDADAPTWHAFLRSLWPDDPDSIAALQEFVGYILSGRTDLQKIMLLVGPSRSGKGTIHRVVAALIGRRNTCGPTLASLATNFGLSPLLGKPLALVSDARIGRDERQIVERLLSISGEDMLTVDRKFKDPWSGKLPTRFFICSNELPRFGDASAAIVNRFIILTMTRSFLGNENPGLTDELLAELPGILNWALDGLARLTERGRFTEPESSAEARLQLDDLASPTSAFVRDRCELTPGQRVWSDELYRAWCAWSEEGGARPTTERVFGRDLAAAAPSVRRRRASPSQGRRYFYDGISLASTAHNGDFVGDSWGPIESPQVEQGPVTSPQSTSNGDQSTPPDDSPHTADLADLRKIAGQDASPHQSPTKSPLRAEHDGPVRARRPRGTPSCDVCGKPVPRGAGGRHPTCTPARCRVCGFPITAPTDAERDAGCHDGCTSDGAA
ncbi:DNA primase family protein [Tsukamurella tyrosinosolvens]|uniref:DNA primase family protein n=1 Tax=Tsukamurella tyrosinosolvens TaxID=57704 RepID=UPI000DF6A48A|nr:phage/plasmid primase, P4 family [Tsukamurella tyrosinosolvens]RDB46826.1 NTP-binding protein [Tsukamurella tyrosinosolvens]